MLKACGNPLVLADALNTQRRICRAQISKRPSIDQRNATEEKPQSRPSYSQDYVIIAE